MSRYINSTSDVWPKSVAHNLKFSGSGYSSAPAGMFSLRRERYFSQNKVEQAERNMGHAFVCEGAIAEDADELNQVGVRHDHS